MLIYSTLAQTAPPADFIRDHSSMVAWIIGGLLAIVFGQLAVAGGWIRAKFVALENADEERSRKAHEDHRRIEGRVEEVDAKVEVVKVEVAEYKAHVGVGDAELHSLKARIEAHMTEEEAVVWSGMKSLGEKLSALQVENVTAHAAIIEKGHEQRLDIGQRVSALEAQQHEIMGKVESIEGKLPNGDTARLTKLLEAVLKGQK
jgi:chromosome segregation ATPase